MSFAHGKIIVIGEHAVVHGEPAISVAIEKGVRVNVEKHEQDMLTIEPWNLSFSPADEQPTSEAFQKLLNLFDTKQRPPLKVQASVEIPGGAGLGCSAALGVAVLSGINDFLETNHTKHWISEHSLFWEKVFHGNPSGIDNHTAAFGGIVKFKKGDKTQRLKSPNPLHFVVAFSGQPSSTKRMIANVEDLLETKPIETQKQLSMIGRLTEKASIAIEQDDLKTLGDCMNQNHEILRSLRISTPNLDDMCQAAIQAGALGAKLTGGGGGGCMIALAKLPKQANQIREALLNQDPSTFITKVQ